VTDRLETVIRLAALGFALAAAQLDAQQLRGTVTDSASRLPIPGAVITTLDSAGRVGRRSISDERGAYAVTATADARRLRIVRLGFRPVEVDLPVDRTGRTLDVFMTRIPYQLQPVRVTAGANCPRRSDRAAALALLEQARAGLLATVVARSERPAQMKRLMIERRMAGTSDRIARHHVRVETVSSSVAAFRAAQSATDFVRRGFAADSADEATFYAPDADVLLDDGFAAGYCFHIMDRDRARPNQVGLGFKAADRRRGRIDVQGALWIDTVARALVDIVFRYEGLDRQLDQHEPGGWVKFREMSNGVVLIDQWFLRLVGPEPDTVNGGRRPLDPVGRPREMSSGRSPRLVIAEIGGELARATWPDGTTWVASLGTLALTVTTMSGEPLPGMVVRLDDTDYRATTDSVGHLEIVDLAPGPYSALVGDARLEPLGVSLRTPISFTATRGQTRLLALRTPGAEEYVRERCRKSGQKVDGSAVLIGRVTNERRQPMKDVSWSLRLENGSAVVTIPPGVTGTDGIFHYCNASRFSRASFRFNGHGETLAVSETLSDPLNIFSVTMSSR
jgi:hypothetical protein